MPAKALKQKWANREATYGSVIRLGSTWVAEVFAQSGLDIIWVDMQHGMNAEHMLVPMLQAMNGTGVTPLVRVAANDGALINRAIDAGAEGVIVPMVETVEEAKKAVTACRLMPEGTRSYGVLRLDLLPDGPGRDTICLVMIETALGLKNLDEILSVPGVDGVFLGPFDLSLSIDGRIGTDGRPVPTPGALTRIREACDARGLVCGITGDARDMREEGYGFISLGSDSIFLLEAFQAALKRRDIS